MNKVIKLILFSFGLLFLFGLIYRVGFYGIIEIITKAKLSFLFLGVLVYLILIFTRSLKWFLLVRIIGDGTKYRQFLPLYLVNSLMGNITPFKSGETITPFLFKKYLKIPVGQGFSIVILDRLFELIIFIIILVLAVFYTLNRGIQNSLILSIFQGILVALFLLLAILIILVASKRITLKIIKLFNFFRRYSLGKKILEFAEKELDAFYGILPLFKDKGIYKFMIPLTLLGWFFEILASYLVFSSVLPILFIDIATAQIIVMAATFVTFIPGGVGIAEIGVVYILGLFGYSLALAASGVLLVRLFLTSTLLISGLIGFLLVRERRDGLFKKGTG